MNDRQETGAPAPSETRGGLRRTLGLRDLVLLNIACIFGLSSLAQVAQFGYGSLLLYGLAIFAFLIPSGLMVAELNARMPEEGGLYRWTRSAFGDLHGYLAAWTYWLSNIVWLPTVMMLLALSFLYVLGGSFLALAEDPAYTVPVCLGILWGATALNLLGMQRAKWIQNIGGAATWLLVVLLVAVGSLHAARFGSAHPFAWSKLLPEVTDLSLLPFFAIVAFSFGGLELAPVLAGEIRDPRRSIPRAVVLASIAVALLYMAGTVMLLVTVAEGDVGVIEGVAQAFHEAGAALGVPSLGRVGAVLVALSTLGLFGSWLTGTARLPFVVGLDHYLPDAFGRVSRRWGSPYVSLLVQAVILTVLLWAASARASVKEAFLVLLDMSVILYFIPFLYMFAALVWHVRAETGRGVIAGLESKGAAVWGVAGLGFSITLLSTVVSVIPSKEVEDGAWFVTKVLGGAGLLISIGLVVYALERRTASVAAAERSEAERASE